MRRSGLYKHVPEPVTIEGEMERIHTRDKLYTRLRQLNRAVRADALRPVHTDQGTVPYYLKHEVDIATNTANRIRKQLRDRLYPDLDDMEPEKRERRLVNRNLRDLRKDYTAEGMRDAQGETDYLDEGKIYSWLNAWVSNSAKHAEFAATKAIVERFIRTDRKTLQMNLESDYDEKEPEFIYPQSSYMEPFDVRQSKAARFWRDMEAKYLERPKQEGEDRER